MSILKSMFHAFGSMSDMKVFLCLCRSRSGRRWQQRDRHKQRKTFMSDILPNAWNIDFNIDISPCHEQLRILAMANKGACTKLFGQGSDNTAEGLGHWYHQKAG